MGIAVRGLESAAARPLRGRYVHNLLFGGGAQEREEGFNSAVDGDDVGVEAGE